MSEPLGVDIEPFKIGARNIGEKPAIVRMSQDKAKEKEKAARRANRLSKPSPFQAKSNYSQPEVPRLDTDDPGLKIAPLDIDTSGAPIRPPKISWIKRKFATEKERKILFLQMFNYSGGVIGLSCQEAGITRRYFKKHWADDSEFKALMSEQMEEIVDRAILRHNQSMLLTPGGDGEQDKASLREFIKDHQERRKEAQVTDDSQKPINIPRAIRSPDQGS